MPIIESTEKKRSSLKSIYCYNCGTEIIEASQNHCPNCEIILFPNDYIKWARAWWGFMCLLCIIPFFLVVLFNYLQFFL